MPKGGRNLEKVLVVINYCSYVEFLEVAFIVDLSFLSKIISFSKALQ